MRAQSRTACESSRARGEGLKSDKICLTLTEKLGEVIWGIYGGISGGQQNPLLTYKGNVIAAAASTTYQKTNRSRLVFLPAGRARRSVRARAGTCRLQYGEP